MHAEWDHRAVHQSDERVLLEQVVPLALALRGRLPAHQEGARSVLREAQGVHHHADAIAQTLQRNHQQELLRASAPLLHHHEPRLFVVVVWPGAVGHPHRHDEPPLGPAGVDTRVLNHIFQPALVIQDGCRVQGELLVLDSRTLQLDRPPGAVRPGRRYSRHVVRLPCCLQLHQCSLVHRLLRRHALDGLSVHGFRFDVLSYSLQGLS
mmetsp:Transcript_48265/g.92279  ORF Transcript_48265/g.92279 Transcript_48265/m.92279 type:complete len:208 (-) Transcript_48265:859-1482(-)